MSTEFKAGELVTLWRYYHDDECSDGPFFVLKDFDMRQVAEQCKADYKPTAALPTAGPGDLQEWLLANGFIEVFGECPPVRHIHLGDYGKIEIESDDE